MLSSRSFLFAALLLLCTAAGAWDRGAVQRFATLPEGALNPEGIAIEPHSGDVYVTGFNPLGAGAGKIYVFDDNGRFKRTITVSGSSSALLGIDFHPDTHAMLVADLGAGNLLDVDPHTGAATPIMTVGPSAGLNALTFDHAGNIYVSGSFSGAIYKTGPNGGAPTIWKQDDLLLKTAGFPPFGANGLQFNRHESALFVANTGNDTVVRIESAGGVAGAASVFTNSINGADGLMLDEHDNVWVCANQADEIVVTDPTGKAIAKLGDFDGVRDGSPVGLLFPASLVRREGWIYITNLSLDLRKVPGVEQQSVDSQWAARVTRHTISRLRARIP